MKTKLLIISGALLFLLNSCGTQKTVTGEVDYNQKIREVVKGHQKFAPEFNTLEADIRANYKTGENSRSISVSLRIAKNDTIWMSAKVAGLFPIAKILITQEGVQYFEKINGVYFKGGFEKLSQWLGTDLNFKKLQSLLIGQVLYGLNDKKWNYSISDLGYQLSSDSLKPARKYFLIGPKQFRLKSEKIVREKKGQSLEVIYPEYQKVENQLFPEKIKIFVTQGNENTKISIDYYSVNFNADISFPYQVPEDYERIRIIK